MAKTKNIPTDELRATAADAASRIGDAVSGAASAAHDVLSDAKDRAGDAAGDAASRTQDAMPDTATDAQRQVAAFARRHPLLAAVVVGLVAAFFLAARRQ